MSNDIRSTLTISPQEAANGAVRSVFLPNGQRTNVSVPASAHEGQVLQIPLPDQPGMLILTLHIAEGQGTPPPPPGNSVPPPGSPSTPFPYETRTVPANPSVPGFHAEVAPPPPPSGANWATQAPTVPPPPPTIGPSLPQQHTVAPPQSEQPYYQPPAPRKGISSRVILLIVLAVVIIAGASTLFVFANNAAQQTAHSNQTATANASINSANATATGIVNATKTAQADASTAVAQATETVRRSNPNPYSSGSLLFYDKLDGSSKNAWSNDSVCAFSDGAYHEISNKVGFIYFCSLKNTTENIASFTDFTLEVKVSILKGDVGGVRFHAVDGNGYVMMFDSEGHVRVSLYKSGSSEPHILWDGSSSAIKRGYNQTNTIGIVVKGNTFTFYINSQNVKSLTDSTYTEGNIDLVGGLYSDSDNKNSDVAFNTLRMWV